MSVTMDGLYVDGEKVVFHPEDILTGDPTAYTEEIGTAVNAWMEENVTGGEQVTDTTLTLSGVPADAKVTGDEISSLKEDLSDIEPIVYNRFIASDMVQGTLYNGVINATNQKCITQKNYQKVTANKLSVVYTKNWNVRVSFFNSQKQFLNQVGYNLISTFKNYTVPSGAVYYRVSLSGDPIGWETTSPADVENDVVYIGTEPSLRNYVYEFKSQTENRLELKTDIEIGVNRYLSSGVLIVDPNRPDRASQAGKPVFFKTLSVIPNENNAYSIALFVNSGGTTWVEAVSATSVPFTYTFTNERSYVLQVICNSNIPQDAVPFRLFTNLPDYVDVLHNYCDYGGNNFEWEIGTVYHGVDTVSTTRIRSGYIKVKKGVVVEAFPPTTYKALGYCWFDSSFVYDSTKDHDWAEGNIAKVDEDGYIRILLRKASDATITESDINDLASMLVIHDHAVGEIEANDLIAKSVSPKMPVNLPQYNYEGEKISVGHKIAYKAYMTLSSESSESNQGCACYGKYLFAAYNKLPMISIYDMETKSHVANIEMTEVSTYHCNNVNFGSEKYDANDPFPVLYISMENVAEHKCLVFRITESNGVYSATLVQTITYPVPSDVGMYYPNCVIDAVNNLICVMGYSTNSYIATDSTQLKINVYNLPKLSAGDVQLVQSDVIKTGVVKSLTATQGAFIDGDNIIQVYGAPSFGDGSIYLGQLSLSASKFITLIRLNDIGINDEPESVFVYDGGLYILFVSRKIYRIYLE